MRLDLRTVGWPLALAAAGVLAIVTWTRHKPAASIPMRVPGTDHQPAEEASSAGNPVLRSVRSVGTGRPSEHPGSWAQFRGDQRDGMSHESVPLARNWPPGGPRVLWSIPVGEGYAGPAVAQGRVYLMDYDREKQQDALRCLSFEDGAEIWRLAYPVSVKRNHGMSRTVPCVVSNLVTAMGPKCHVICADALTGELRWGLDLVREHGATVPAWYAGQCPLVDGERVILAPGGEEALLVAVRLADGELVWKTPNPAGWKMTHSSIATMELDGERMFVYCGSGGVVGVSVADGRTLWQTTDWKISIATVPSPVILPEGRIFLSGGYNAGSVMLRVTQDAGQFRVKTEYRLKPTAFGATQHTPVLLGNHLYGIHADGPAVCLNLDGSTQWSSDPLTFGLGPLLLADGLLFAADDTGKLSLLEAQPGGYKLLAQTQAIAEAHDTWAPMALAGGRLLVRDLTRMICLDVADPRR